MVEPSPFLVSPELIVGCIWRANHKNSVGAAELARGRQATTRMMALPDDADIPRRGRPDRQARASLWPDQALCQLADHVEHGGVDEQHQEQGQPDHGQAGVQSSQARM